MRFLLPFVLLISLTGCGGTGLGLDLVPEQQAEAMGLEAWQAIRAETPVSTNSEYRQRAERVSARLLQAAGKAPSQWEVAVFGSDEVNAFALPGRKIGIHEGMMRMARTDDQLAAVIGHEIAHVEARHPSERISSQMATETAVEVAGSVLGTSLGTDPRMVAGLLGAGAQFGVLLPYSRNQELEADALGLRLMAAAGYDPREAVTLWENMKGATARAPAFLSTHPAPEARIKQLQAQMPEALKAYQGRG